MMRNAWASVAFLPLISLFAACGSEEEKPPTPVPSITASWRGESTEYCTSELRILQGDVQGDPPDEVVLLRNSERWTVLSPPYQFQVNCDQEPERSYEFQIRARIGTRTVTSPIKTLIIDRTAPSIVGGSPNNSSSIRRDTPIRFQFSEPVKTAYAPTTFLSGASGSVLHTASLSEDGRTLTLVPTEPLRAPSKYEATLSGGGITDMAGNPLRESSATISWEVLPFVPMEPVIHDVSSISVARGRSGTPWMATQSISGDKITVWQLSPQGWKVWGAELTSHIGSSKVALTLDPDEEPIVATVEHSDTLAEFVRVMRWSNGAWQQLGGLLDASPSEDFIPGMSVAADSKGNPTVVWLEDSSVHVRRWTGTAWEALGSPIGSLSDETDHPAVAVDSQDRVVLAYTQLPSSGSARVFVQRWEGSAWAAVGAGLGGTTTGVTASDVELTIGPGDAPVVAWIEGLSTDRVFAARWADGAWQSSPALGESWFEDLSIAVDANGRVLIGWWNEDPVQKLSRRLVYTARFENGAWSSGVLTCLGDDPHVSFTADGMPMLWATSGESTIYQPFIED